MVEKTEYKIILLICREHGHLLEWNQYEIQGGAFVDFATYLRVKGWGYDLQSTPQYYCPSCLDKIGASAGLVDPRKYIGLEKL